MKKFFAIFVAIIVVLSFTATVFAADVAAGTAKTYPAGPVQKAERGFGNILFGWTEIPKRIVDKTKESNPVKGILLGTFQGTCKAFARTASGAVDVATFPFVGKGYEKPAVTPDMAKAN